jgi:FeS assembly SUF system protein
MAAIIITKNTELTQRIIDQLKTCYDPEIPVDVWELGLIYEINLGDDLDLLVTFTLTSPNCPAVETLPAEMESKIREIIELKSVKMELTFEPTWTKEMMSEVAQVELGFM